MGHPTWWLASGWLVAGVVGVVGEDGEGAVDLLGGDGAGEFVGEGHAAERDGAVGAGEGGGGPAVGGADGEEDALGAVVAKPGDERGELFGGEGVAAGVEEEDLRGGAAGLAVGRGEEGGFGVEDGGGSGAKAGSTGYVVAGEGVGGGGFGFAGALGDGGEDDLHLVQLPGVYEAVRFGCGGLWFLRKY